MKSTSIGNAMSVAGLLALLVCSPSGPLYAADVKLPVIHGKKAVAAVNGEPITLREYGNEFASIHEGATEKEQIRKKDPGELLERMIKIKLIVQEAENIGLDGLPDVQKAIGVFEQNTLRALLFTDRTRNIRTADPKEIAKIYKESVKEIKVDAVLLDSEEDAKSLRSAIKEAGDFSGPVKKMIEEGKGKGSGTSGYVKAAELSPEVARVVSEMKAGEVSPIINLGKKFTILKVEAFRFPDNAAKRTEAEREARNRKGAAELRKYVSTLQKKYVKYNDNVLKSLDFEADEPGFEKLLNDARPVAWIKGEKPVTVMELAEELHKVFFHGIEQSIKQKRVNSKKDQTLEQMLMKRVVQKEAKRRKLDQSPMFKERVGEYRKELLFGTFVQKVIDPENRVDDEELRTFMKEHIADYTAPERIRVDFLVFTNKDDAEGAIGKLRDGADFQWLRSNAPGQADPSTVKEVLELGGKLLLKSELPDAIAQAASGAGAGDLRLQAGADGLFYVIAVQEVVPSRPEEYENVKDRLAQRVFNEKRVKALEEWMERLKSASKVEIYVQGKQLRQLLETRAW